MGDFQLETLWKKHQDELPSTVWGICSNSLSRCPQSYAKPSWDSLKIRTLQPSPTTCSSTSRTICSTRGFAQYLPWILRTDRPWIPVYSVYSRPSKLITMLTGRIFKSSVRIRAPPRFMATSQCATSPMWCNTLLIYLLLIFLALTHPPNVPNVQNALRSCRPTVASSCGASMILQSPSNTTRRCSLGAAWHQKRAS